MCNWTHTQKNNLANAITCMWYGEDIQKVKWTSKMNAEKKGQGTAYIS